MTDFYSPPKQSRAQSTELKFLRALDKLLHQKSFALLTIDEIAEEAQLTRSAFLKRFGSKNKALLILYEGYCEKVMAAMLEVSDQLTTCSDALDACYRISTRAERLQQEDFSANRAMHELFMENLTIASQTKGLYRECVKLMQKIQKIHLPPGVGTSTGAYAGAQLIFTINYNHSLKAMPGLPQESSTRHKLIAALVVEALHF